MNDNGAIICLQKYSSEYRDYQSYQNDGPICLGYFNRIEVCGVRTFRKYVHHASKYQADLACSRKQLLLRTRKGLHEEIVIRDDNEDTAGMIPFRSSNPTEEYYLGCCSVFNIRDSKCRSDSAKSGKCVTRENLANEIHRQIKKIQHDGNFRFAILESLGAEDLCLIVLTNHYSHISDVITVLQSFNCQQSPEKDACASKCIIDNGHSILMIDRKRAKEHDMWGSTQSSIHFSLRSAGGLHYLRSVEQALKEPDVLQAGETVTLDGCSGEYDAIMRCPARFLTEQLFGEQGYFAPENRAYQRSVYQSETFVYPIGTEDAPMCADPPLTHADSQLKTELNHVIENAVTELRAIFHYDENDPDFDYIELPIWRLLKDYWSFASFPLNKALKEDLKIQLIASVNAIVEEAKKYAPGNKTEPFLASYDKIVDALRASMQAGSQQDRWYFGEQKSYIQNVESYYKILHGYYGIIKDMIALIYHIERLDGRDQPLLIPLLSFGVKTIIQSDSYACTVDGKPARLICIRLPYQALANLPRYLGPLAHELFHYSAPAERSTRNERMIKELLRLSMTEFVSILAKGQGYTDSEDYWKRLFSCGESNRGVFDLDAAVDQAYRDLQETIQEIDLNIQTLKLTQIRDCILPDCLFFPLSRADKKPDKLYFRIWRNIGKMVRHLVTTPDAELLSSDDLTILKKIFAQTPEQEIADSEGTSSLYRQLTNKITVDDIKNFRKLLRNTFRAMEECPADIFNLEVVMAGKNDRHKIRQYLWQINSARRDTSLMRSFVRSDPHPPHDAQRQNRVMSNHIRVAMIINYYLTAQGSMSLAEALTDWAPENGSYKMSLDNVRQGFISDYEHVMVRFIGLLEDNRTICQDLSVRIRRLLDDDDCRRIMDRLTRKYEQYYLLHEQRQHKNDANRETIYEDHLFDLCCDLIDTYQAQTELDLISTTSMLLPSEKRTSSSEAAPPSAPEPSFSCIASCSSSISGCIMTAAERMKVHNEIPPLWFHGESQNQELPRNNAAQSAENRSSVCSTQDFCDSFYAEMERAIRLWPHKEGSIPNHNAVITVLNPHLFNLAMDLLEDVPGAALRMSQYMHTEGQLEYTSQADVCSHRYPRVCISDHSCSLVWYAPAEQEASPRSLKALHCAYLTKYQAIQNDPENSRYFHHEQFIPFLFQIELNHLHYVDFKKHLRAIGISRKAR